MYFFLCLFSAVVVFFFYLITAHFNEGLFIILMIVSTLLCAGAWCLVLGAVSILTMEIIVTHFIYIFQQSLALLRVYGKG